MQYKFPTFRFYIVLIFCDGNYGGENDIFKIFLNKMALLSC